MDSTWNKLSVLRAAAIVNMNRALLIAIIAIVALIIIGVGAFFSLRGEGISTNGGTSFFGNLPFIGGKDDIAPQTPAPAPEPPPANNTVPTATPGVDEGRPLIQVIDRDVLAPVITKEGNALRYVARENGHVFQTDLAGANERALVKITIPEPYEGFWAPLRNRAALFYIDGGIPKKFLAGVATGTASRFLPPEITSLDWSPDGVSLAYLSRRTNDVSLTIADASGQKPVVVYTTPIPDFTIRWVAKNTILLISRPSGMAPSLVLRFSVQSRTTDVLLANRNGIVVQPLADGGGFLFSESDGEGRAGALSLFDLATNKITPLNVTTLADKCSQRPNGKKIYCGVPRGTILAPSPDEWYKGTASFLDSIVEIDIANGNQRELPIQGVDVDVIAVFPSPDGRYLFFHDKQTGTLWRFALR